MRTDVPMLRGALAALLTSLTLGVRAAVPGGIEVIDLPADATQARYGGHRVLVLAEPKPVAIVGIGLDAKPGRHSLTVESASKGSFEISFDVDPKSFPVQRLKLPPDKVNPPADVLDRIEREARLSAAQYALFTPQRASPFPMALPAKGPVSSNFGLRRILNGEPRSPHAGLDVAAPLGALVTAPADGRVSLVGDFYFTGNVVFIDHGAGVISMMCHLSAVDVKDGELVVKGQPIGRVGATGRATGPHLHWSVSMNAERVDPSAVLALFRPKPAKPG